MPTGGLSLLGFMEQQLALHYLTTSCIVADTSPTALLRHWNDARRRLGPPDSRVGVPDIQDIPAPHSAHLQQLAAHPRLLKYPAGTWEFKLVEIGPLLAFQFHVDIERSSAHCRGIQHPPELADTVPVCLPQSVEHRPIHVSFVQHGLLLRDQSLNFRIMGAGLIGEDLRDQVSLGGVAVGVTDPWVSVVRFNGRCYLRNGYHRVYGLRAAGATHIPCLFWDVTDYSRVGAIGGVATFDRSLLESSNPPTCRHLTDALAYRVILRRMSRFIHVTWAEYAVPED